MDARIRATLQSIADEIRRYETLEYYLDPDDAKELLSEIRMELESLLIAFPEKTDAHNPPRSDDRPPVGSTARPENERTIRGVIHAEDCALVSDQGSINFCTCQ